MKKKIAIISVSGLIMLALYGVLALALLGVQPLLSWTETVISWTRGMPALTNWPPETPTPSVETFTVCGKTYTLEKRWVVEGSKELKFRAESPPYILVVKAEVKTSTLAPTFNPFVYHEDSVTDFGILGLPHTVCDGAYTYQLQQEGNYFIRVKAFGYRWYAKAGQ